MASEIWSATLSGWPSETDSDVKENRSPWLIAPKKHQVALLGLFGASANALADLSFTTRHNGNPIKSHHRVRRPASSSVTQRRLQFYPRQNLAS
jgi:hypothetical protein